MRIHRVHAVGALGLSALLLLLVTRLPHQPRRRTVRSAIFNDASPAGWGGVVENGTSLTRDLYLAGLERPSTSSNRDLYVESPEPPRTTLIRDLYVAGHQRLHPELCPSLGARLKLLILVASAPPQFAEREAVRLTWGHYAARADVALAFVLGAFPPTLQQRIEAEDSLYGDLVVGHFVDSYSNLTLKTLSMLEWADSYCPRAPMLLKTDDDMFINVPRLLQFAAKRANQTKTIWGEVIKKGLPMRATAAKHYVSVVEFPRRVFPVYATGPAYLVSGDSVRALRAAAPPLPYLRLEDVFVTGELASRVGVRRVNAPQFYNRKVPAFPCKIQRGIALHMVRYHEQFDLWRKMLDGRYKCW